MSEEKKVRKPRADKGVPRGPKARMPLIAGLAPIHVKLWLKGDEDPVEFGCARRSIEPGFHVFFYPSELDRYRVTRKMVAISEIREIEITEAQEVYDLRTAPAQMEEPVSIPRILPAETGPRVHSARKDAMAKMDLLERASGSVKMDALPGMQFGGSDVG